MALRLMKTALEGLQYAGGRFPRRHSRLLWAMAVSVLFHGMLLATWLAQVPLVKTPKAEREAMEVQWITADFRAPPPALPATPSPEPSAVGRALPASARMKRPAVAVGSPMRTGAAPAVSAEGAAVASAPANPLPPLRGDSSTPTAQQLQVPPTPLPAASGSRSPEAARWSHEDIARALRKERDWQRRHGLPSASVMAAQDPSSMHRTQGLPHAREWRSTDGARVTRVEGAGGVYCVRVPSANQPLEMGAAPRVAPVTSCP